MRKEIVNETSTLLQYNEEQIKKLQSENSVVVRTFFEKVFEDNGNNPIPYKGANKGQDNLIVDEGEIVAINELFTQDNVIKVRGYYEEDNVPFTDELMNLENKNIVGIFEMFKEQF